MSSIKYVLSLAKGETKTRGSIIPVMPAGVFREEVAGYFWILNPEGLESQKTVPTDADWNELCCRMIQTEVSAGAQYIWGFGKGLCVGSG